MKARFAVVFALLTIFAGIHCATAHSEDTKTFYNNCIDKKIAQCELKASRADTNFPCMKECAQRAAARANYYRTHRKLLVQEMERQNLGQKAHKVDHFLNKSFAIELAKAGSEL